MASHPESKELVPNGYGNYMLTLPLPDSDPELVLLKSKTKATPSAIMLTLDLSNPSHVANIPMIIRIGFLHRHTMKDGKKSLWWIQNDSPAPLPFSAISSAFVIHIEDGKVLTVADKHRPGLTMPGGSGNANELPSETGSRELGEETGKIVSHENLELVAQIWRKNANEFGANECINYFSCISAKGELKAQESEISWAGFFPATDFVAGTCKHKDRAPSQLSKKIVNHVLTGRVNKGTRETTLDIRQFRVAPEKQDKSDTMDITYF